jgi:hypothetical protein
MRSRNLGSKRSKTKEYVDPQATSCKDVNIIVIKGSSDASNHIPWVLVYPYILVMILACALDYMSWIDVVAALGSPSNLLLLIIWLEIGC